MELEEAVAAYRAALEEWTRDRAPLKWAMAQNNLGTARFRLGERESGTVRLEEAVAAYGVALEVRTRDRVPLQWAKSTGNQGVALMLLAQRRRDATRAGQAVRQIEVALVTTRDGGDDFDAAFFEERLTKARALSGSLTSLPMLPERPASIRLLFASHGALNSLILATNFVDPPGPELRST